MWPSPRDEMLAERILEDIDIVARRIEHFSLTKDAFCTDRSFRASC